MITYAKIGRLAVGLALLISFCPRVRATITVLDYWRMGENDPGAMAGRSVTNTADPVGGLTLTNQPSAGALPVYTNNISVQAAAATGSALSEFFAGGHYLRGNAIPGLTTNFGLELWVYPTAASSGGVVAYNGNTGGSGWGIYQSGAAMRMLFGGLSFSSSVAVATNSWIHLALICNRGVTTLYTNGVPTSATLSHSPNAPAVNASDGFLVGADNSGAEPFVGGVDEMRVFTFAPAQFSTNDLLLYQQPLLTLSATNLVESPDGGIDSVGLGVWPPGATWAAATATPWLHLAVTNRLGSDNLIVGFKVDTNSGPTRTGQLTIAGQTVTITQAGSTYIAAGLTPLFDQSQLQGLAVDGRGNVYTDANYEGRPGTSDLYEWIASSQSWNVLDEFGSDESFVDLAVQSGSVYIANASKRSIERVNGSQTQQLVSESFIPFGVALDSATNVYFSEIKRGSVQEWLEASGTVVPLVTNGLVEPEGLAVDAAGNVYIADAGTNAIVEWNAASRMATNLASGFVSPTGVAVDGAGNVYVADPGAGAVQEWNAASGTLINLVPAGSLSPSNVALDSAGNVYLLASSSVFQLTRAFVDATARSEPFSAGSDALPVVVPAALNLGGVYWPASDQSWLTITDVYGGVVSFAFGANPALARRTAHITLLGQTIAVTQSIPPTLFALPTLAEGPAPGTDSVVLATATPATSWTALAGAAWLHVAAGSQSGTGGANVLFTFDGNPGGTRTGTITAGAAVLTVTQAGSTYTNAGTLTSLPVTVLAGSVGTASGVAVDGSGNVYAPDFAGSLIRKWQPGNLQTSVISNHLSAAPVVPLNVAADSAGDLFIVDANNRALEQWSAANGHLTVLASPAAGVQPLEQIAVDAGGNVYFADTFSNVIGKWSVATGAYAPLITGLNQPEGVAVDFAGNVYVADTGNNQVLEWAAGQGPLTVLITNLNQPAALAVDGSGNVYVADLGNGAVKKWSPATGGVTTLASGLLNPCGVAVDALGNVYVAVQQFNPASELPRAFVDPSPRIETSFAGTDSLPPVLPLNESLLYPLEPIYYFNTLPLTLDSIGNDVLSFSFTNNYSASLLTSSYTVLGQSITITQNPLVPPILTTTAVAPSGIFQLGFTNNPAGTFTVLATTNLAAPVWTALGPATNLGGGVFQFSTPLPTNRPRMFFRVQSP